MTDRYPLCTAARLLIFNEDKDFIPFVRASEVEAYLLRTKEKREAVERSYETRVLDDKPGSASPWRFSAEEFEMHGVSPHYSDQAVAAANAKLKEWLSAAPVVYGRTDRSDLGWTDEHTENDTHGTADTHTARLVCIEPIARDTAEGLLREMLAWWQSEGDTSDPRRICARARTLLGEE